MQREDVRRNVDWLVSRSPADGARLVARAWVDPEFKAAAARRRACRGARARSRLRARRRSSSPSRTRSGAPHGRLHALLVLPARAARPAAGLVQEPAVPLAGGLRSARRARGVRASSSTTTSSCGCSTRPPTFGISCCRAAPPGARSWRGRARRAGDARLDDRRRSAVAPAPPEPGALFRHRGCDRHVILSPATLSK